jgi:hypothetical protein
MRAIQNQEIRSNKSPSKNVTDHIGSGKMSVVVPNVRNRDRKLTPIGSNWQSRNWYSITHVYLRSELPNIPVYRLIVAAQKCTFDVASAVVQSTGAAVNKMPRWRIVCNHHQSAN